MIWLDGSVLHDPPVKHYECRRCRLYVVRFPDGNYEVKQMDQDGQQESPPSSSQ